MTDAAGTSATRVIVADDDDDIRHLVTIAVRRAGFELVAALADGDQAWDAIQAERPDLVVLDVSMPGATGLEVCGLIRSTPSLTSTRVLLLSASVTDDARRAGRDSGADSFVAKPFSPRELATRLVELMSDQEAVS